MKMKNKKLYLTVIGALLLVFIIIGVSYAYFSAKLIEVNKTETKIKTQVMGLTYSGQTEISCTNMVPGNKCIKTFKVENSSDVAVYYNIYMESITNEFNEDLVYTLTDDNGTVIEETTLPETNASKTYLKKGITIGANATKNYTLTIEYKYLDTPQNDYQGAEFKATVGIDAEQTGDKYKLTGTVVKLLSGGQTEAVTSGNLVFFSEKQDIAIQSDGTFEATNLEAGNHEVYYMGTQDASDMTKEQVRANALCEMRTFNILTTTRVELTCKEGVDPIGLEDIVPTPQIPAEQPTTPANRVYSFSGGKGTTDYTRVPYVNIANYPESGPFARIFSSYIVGNDGPGRQICTIITGNLECFDIVNYENEGTHMLEAFGSTMSCSTTENSVSCRKDDFNCGIDLSDDVYVRMSFYDSGKYCYGYPGGYVECY